VFIARTGTELKWMTKKPKESRTAHAATALLHEQSDGWGSEEFLTCVSYTVHVIAIGWTSVRHSVRLSCPSHAGIVSKRLNLCQTASSLPGSPMILVF